MANEEKPIKERFISKANYYVYQDFLIGTFIEEQIKDHGFESAVDAARDKFPVRGRRAARSTITDAYKRYRHRERFRHWYV
jgi:hypothetical protein